MMQITWTLFPVDIAQCSCLTSYSSWRFSSLKSSCLPFKSMFISNLDNSMPKVLWQQWMLFLKAQTIGPPSFLFWAKELIRLSKSSNSLIKWTSMTVSTTKASDKDRKELQLRWSSEESERDTGFCFRTVTCSNLGCLPLRSFVRNSEKVKMILPVDSSILTSGLSWPPCQLTTSLHQFCRMAWKWQQSLLEVLRRILNDHTRTS